jgi:hypothetical protein
LSRDLRGLPEAVVAGILKEFEGLGPTPTRENEDAAHSISVE